jgi:hypothetical protein
MSAICTFMLMKTVRKKIDYKYIDNYAHIAFFGGTWNTLTR